MYTVCRFVAGDACSDATLIDLGGELNLAVPGSFTRLDRVGRRFSVSVSSDDDWTVHERAILAFIRKAVSVIANGRAKDVSVVIDIAVEPDDLSGKLFYSCEMAPAALAELGQNGVGLTFTVYGPRAGP